MNGHPYFHGVLQQSTENTSFLLRYRPCPTLQKTSVSSRADGRLSLYTFGTIEDLEGWIELHKPTRGRSHASDSHDYFLTMTEDEAFSFRIQFT